MSRHVQFVPNGRNIDRATWKALDRMLRGEWRKQEKEMMRAFQDALIYGTGVVYVPSGTIEALPIDLGGDK